VLKSTVFTKLMIIRCGSLSDRVPSVAMAPPVENLKALSLITEAEESAAPKSLRAGNTRRQYMFSI
jgi:hypothetical protein